jgi:hypothetical protein
MPRVRAPRADQVRNEVANEAARMMREHGIKDFLLAKKKAAQRLAVRDRRALPGNDEIAAALEQQQRLFGGEAYPARLELLRKTADEAMKLLEGFEPRLVGAVLSGAVTEYTDVTLHVFADAPEEVALRLMEHNIPYELSERRVRYPQERWDSMPSFRFLAGDVTVESTVFPFASLRNPPNCPVDGRPMRRARRAELAALREA